MDTIGETTCGDLDWLRQWARCSPAKTAFKDADSGRSLSYSEIYQLSCAVATKLESKFAVGRGDRVALLATNELESVVLFFACLRLGAVLVPINFRLTAREIEHVLRDSAPFVIVAQAQFRAELMAAMSVSEQAKAEHTWMFEDLQAEVAAALGDFVAAGGWQRSAKDPDWHRPLRAADTSPCMILYTSGTTGVPKGAIITPKMLHWNSLNTTLRLNLSQNDVFVSFLPFFHTGGWNVLLTPFVHRGACTVLTKKFDADRILSLCESEKATIMFGVPTTMEMMARSELFAKVDLSRVRYAIVGGEPMPIDLIKTWQAKGVAIRQGFGLTEFGPNVFSLGEEDAIRKIGSIGFANFYIQTRVVDERGRDVAAGEIGELILKGPVCTPGYWRNQRATDEAIVGGWFHTGDLVRYDDEGYFYVAGRKKDMFISGGENVYPAEVERVLSQYPGVREVAVLGLPDPKWGEAGCAYVVAAAAPDQAPVTGDALLAFCADKLAKYKIPKQVRFLTELPKGDSGKILKRALRELAI